jgi:hypothetical protein
MMRWVRELRLIPVVLLATASLAALKLLGLVLDGGYLLTDIDLAAMDRPIPVERDAATGAVTVTENKVSLSQQGPSWAQQVLGYPDITGSVAAEKQAEKNAERTTGAPPAKPEKQPGASSTSRPSPLRPPSAPSLSGCRNAARSSIAAAARSSCARTCSRRPRRNLRTTPPSCASLNRAPAVP